MKPVEYLKKFWAFLKEDTWQSWIVSLILIVVLIRFIFFPLLSFVTGSPLPLVVVESCSMYHESNFEEWWQSNNAWYEERNIDQQTFENFPYKNGLNKGDIIFVWGRSEPKRGDIIIFEPNSEARASHPIIHRVVTLDPLATKGDHNSQQLSRNNNVQQIDETHIRESQVLGKSVFKIPLLGWIKLVFFEPLRSADQRGFCK